MALHEHPSSSPAADAQQVYEAVRGALHLARSKTVTAINAAMVEAYWEIGRKIAETVGDRAGYGKRLLHFLSGQLTAEFGKGFTPRNLWHMRQFYEAFPNVHALRAQLSWTHYRLLMRVPCAERREWYMNEAADEGWSSRQLDRQINTSFYDRLLATRQAAQREELKAEIRETQPITQADNVLKDPYVLEFLDIPPNAAMREKDLEQKLIDRLQDFLLELGKGFAFVARQKHIAADTQHFYIDLVFYNYILKCFVLIDLKTGELSHQDIGQMDFYTRIFQERFCDKGDNPPIGIVLCAKKNETIAKYSVLNDKDNLYTAQYLTYLPSEEQLANLFGRERELLEIASLGLGEDEPSGGEEDAS
ncbi:MAG: DUF1016 family protein [Rhodocyclaceae bacterium]|nr:DUF1016 family protein [Rhodocyclaceae bacterium]